jgi:hypothetical protein
MGLVLARLIILILHLFWLAVEVFKKIIHPCSLPLDPIKWAWSPLTLWVLETSLYRRLMP